MQRIRIMTDTAADIPQQLADQLSIRVLPIPIAYEGISLHERVEYTNEQFYELLLSCKSIPVTSQITAHRYFEEYRRAYEEGCDSLINITINSQGSGMFDAACIAKRMFEEEMPEASGFRIEVIDSKIYTIAYGCAVIEAAKMAAAEVEFDVICDYLRDWYDKVEIVCSVYSLDFVKKSGRVSCAAAFVGELLGLRPIILFSGGKASIIGKVRGDRNILPTLVKITRERRCGENSPLIVARGTPVEESEEFAKLLKKEFRVPSIDTYSIGASIAINSGPQVVAAVFEGKKRT